MGFILAVDFAARTLSPNRCRPQIERLFHLSNGS